MFGSSTWAAYLVLRTVRAAVTRTDPRFAMAESDPFNSGGHLDHRYPCDRHRRAQRDLLAQNQPLLPAAGLPGAFSDGVRRASSASSGGWRARVHATNR